MTTCLTNTFKEMGAYLDSPFEKANHRDWEKHGSRSTGPLLALGLQPGSREEHWCSVYNSAWDPRPWNGVSMLRVHFPASVTSVRNSLPDVHRGLSPRWCWILSNWRSVSVSMQSVELGLDLNLSSNPCSPTTGCVLLGIPKLAPGNL